MDDYNDLVYFVSVVEHHGFSSAARATGVEKTRLSRRVAALEQRLGVRLLQLSTRSIALTEAGQRFYDHCVAAVEGARAAYESIVDLRQEPAGTVRMSCAQVMAQSYLAPILPGFLARHPKVNLILDATDREVNLIDERVDLVLRATFGVAESPGLVAKPLGSARRILVASPGYLERVDQPSGPWALSAVDTLGRPVDMFEGQVRWDLNGPGAEAVVVRISPRLVANDQRLLLEAAIHGIGIALLPEPIVATAIRTGQLAQVLPDWTTTTHNIYLLYHNPRGILPGSAAAPASDSHFLSPLSHSLTKVAPDLISTDCKRVPVSNTRSISLPVLSRQTSMRRNARRSNGTRARAVWSCGRLRDRRRDRLPP